MIVNRFKFKAYSEFRQLQVQGMRNLSYRDISVAELELVDIFELRHKVGLPLAYWEQASFSVQPSKNIHIISSCSLALVESHNSNTTH